MQARTLLTATALMALVVPVLGADAKRKTRITGKITGCQQRHRGTVDRIVLTSRARAQKPAGRATAAFQRIEWLEVMTGPSVSKGTATATTNANGVAHAVFEITGPGDYTVKWTAKRTGATPDTGQVKITITGPQTAPCAFEDIPAT